MRFPFGTMKTLPNGCGLRRIAEPRSNILLAFPCLYYENRDILDKNGLNLYRKSLACFEGNAPTYHLALREHPVIVWDFHSLMLAVKFMFSVRLTDAKNPMSLCEHCRMAFYVPRADSRFCSAECRKKASKKS